jgi:flagellar hook assembly protein FlgD
VRLDLYDTSGRRVRTIVDGRRPAGFHTTLWDGRDESGGRVASGVYFVRMQAGDFDRTRRLVVVK